MISSMFAMLHYFLSWVAPWISQLLQRFRGTNSSINIVDDWLCNYNLRRRTWRIPQVCNYIHSVYGGQAEMKLYGQRVVIVTDHRLANEIMIKHGKHLRQRLVGNEAGLANLNMHNTGLIWNNNISGWKTNRQIFETCLKNGLKSLDHLAPSYFEKLEKTDLRLAKPISMLSIVRHFALSMTMQSLFGMETTRIWREKAIRVVGNYFKAWEFFLLTPDTWRFAREEKQHKQACREIYQLSEDIYMMAITDTGIITSTFIADLEKNNTGHNEVVQCITEMLLAGTDTSSLTMFYTLLFLADHPNIGSQICKGLQQNGEYLHSEEITRLYYEAMRLIPVGPVILRKAECDIRVVQQDAGTTLFLAQGDSIIFNIAGMNRVDKEYSNSANFNPDRYDAGEVLPLAFGTGKKSCVGKHFAEKEMQMFFNWFITKYSVFGKEPCMVQQLETRWDIANAPVDDILLSVFPRVPVLLVGGVNCDRVTRILEAVKIEYPNIKIVTEWEVGQKLLKGRDDAYSKFINDLLQMIVEFGEQFGFIQCSILNSLFPTKIQQQQRGVLGRERRQDAGEQELYGRLKNQPVIHLPSSVDDDGEDEKVTQFLNELGCHPIYSIRSKEISGQKREIWDFIAGMRKV